MAKFHDLTQNCFTLIMGPGYSRKTTWTGQAALMGYNCIYLDTDGKTNVLRYLPEEAQKRIDVIDIKDTSTRPVTATFMSLFARNKVFIWDEVDKCSVAAAGELNTDHPHYVVCAALMGNGDLAILDNYTGEVDSVVFGWCIQNNYDLLREVISKDGGDFQESFAHCGSVLTTLINRLRALNKNIIVIAHTVMYEKIRESKKGGKKERVVEYVREQIASSSGMHAQKIPPKFQDTLRFEINGPQHIQIYSSPDKNKDGGSISIPPGVYDWRGDDCKLPFSAFARLAHLHPIPEPNPVGSNAFKYFDQGFDPEELREWAVMAAGIAKNQEVSAPVLPAKSAANAPVQAAKTGSASIAGMLKKPNA